MPRYIKIKWKLMRPFPEKSFFFIFQLYTVRTGNVRYGRSFTWFPTSNDCSMSENM